jgi:hypothetical protein
MNCKQSYKYLIFLFTSLCERSLLFLEDEIMGRTVTLMEAVEVLRRCNVKCGQGVQCTNLSDSVYLEEQSRVKMTVIVRW